MTHSWRGWLPDAVLGVLIAGWGLWELVTSSNLRPGGRLAMPAVDVDPSLALIIIVGFAGAAALSRRLPGIAVALIWLVCAVQVLLDLPIMLVQLSVAIVAFATARWGRRAVLWLSGASIPLGAGIALIFVRENYREVLGAGGLRRLISGLYQLGIPLEVLPLIAGVVVLGLQWLAGLAMRFSDVARRSRQSQLVAEADAARAVRERQQVEEIATLRSEQARLSRDVHDVVGHSLAVILAQAESAQYLGEDTATLKKTMATIATSARTSLQDARAVLTPGSDVDAALRPGGLDELLASVRTSGAAIEPTVIGTPRPLPPELEVVAFRVLQEMLTNAIKHGRRGEPVSVERHWEGELRIEVRNVISGEADAPVVEIHPGQGLEGMRRRLESIGGHLDVRRRQAAAGPTFTATAWIPLRSVGT